MFVCSAAQFGGNLRQFDYNLAADATAAASAMRPRLAEVVGPPPVRTKYGHAAVSFRIVQIDWV